MKKYVEAPALPPTHFLSAPSLTSRTLGRFSLHPHLLSERIFLIAKYIHTLFTAIVNKPLQIRCCFKWLSIRNTDYFPEKIIRSG